MKTRLNVTGVMLFVCLFLSHNAFASGKIRGIVTDKETKEPLIGANVQLLGTLMGGATTLDGSYIILNVKPGTYTLVVSYIGYNSQEIQNVQVESDLTTTIDVELSLESQEFAESIVVIATKPLLQKDETGTRQTVSGSDIKALPVQNFSQVVGYQAGVVSSGRRSFNVRGGRSNEVAFMVDGILVRDPVNGALATNINNDAVEELTFLSGTFNAEYGNAMSGVVNISTREGSNTFRGLIETRRAMLNEPSDSLFQAQDLQAVNFRIDGPILRDKLFFAFTGELYEEGRYTPFGYDKGNNFFGKLSWNAFKGTKISVSLRNSDERYKNYSHAYKYIPDSVNVNKAKSLQGLFSMTNSFSSKVALTTRYSYFDQEYFNGLDKDLSEYVRAVTYLNNTFFGEFFASADPQSKSNTRTRTHSLRSDLLWQVDNYNEVKLGVQYNQHVVDWYSVDNITGAIPYLTDIKGRKPYEGAIYVQDKIEKNAFVLNLGFRLDFANQESSFRQDPLRAGTDIKSKTIWQFSPRIGIAHPISETSILRFSYGRFFQNPDFRFVYENNLYEFGTREPLFGSPDLDAQRTTAYEVGLVQQIDEKTAIKLTAYYKDIRGLIGTEYIAQGQEVNGQVAFTSYSRFVNEDYANVKGFEFNVDTRLTKNYDVLFTYTFSVAKGSSSSETEGYPKRLPSTRLYPLNFDKTHLVNTQFSARFAKEEGFNVFGMMPLQRTRLSVILNGSSGYPYTPSGRDIGFVERNSARYPITYSIDLSYIKTFEITEGHDVDVFMNITNLTDRRNARFVYSDTGKPDEYTLAPQSDEWVVNPNNYSAPRNIVFGIRYQF